MQQQSSAQHRDRVEGIHRQAVANLLPQTLLRVWRAVRRRSSFEPGDILPYLCNRTCPTPNAQQPRVERNSLGVIARLVASRDHKHVGVVTTRTGDSYPCLSIGCGVVPVSLNREDGLR